MKKYWVAGVIAVALVLPMTSFAQVVSGSNATLLNQLNALMEQLRLLQQQALQQGNAPVLAAPVAAPAGFCHTFSTNLGIGASGSEITALHTALTAEGIDVSESDTFDEDSASAVVNFQAKYGIRQTGFVGPLTRAKLNGLYGRCVATSPDQNTPSGTHTYTSIADVPDSFERPLVCGQKGDVNGDDHITKADYNLGRQITLGTIRTNHPEMTNEEAAVAIAAADVNGLSDYLGNPVTTSDLGLIAGYLIGKTNSFTGCVFVPKHIPASCGTKGDVNGDNQIDNADIGLMRSQVLGKFQLESAPFSNADVNGVDGVTTLDITYLRRYLLGLDTTFPACSTVSNSSPITVLSPNGGATYPVGSAVNIQWSNYTGSEPLTVSLQITNPSSGAITNRILSSNVPATAGSYVWNVSPSENAVNKYKIEVYPATGRELTGRSASFFTLSRPLICGALGDVNNDGVISNADADRVSSYISNTTLHPLDDDANQKARADVNGSAATGDPITTNDAALIRSYLATGVSTRFTGCTVAAPTVDLKINNYDETYTVTNYTPGLTLSWTSSDATSCSSNDFSVSGVSGNQSTGVLTAPLNKTYTITCMNSRGDSTSDSVGVSVSSSITPNAASSSAPVACVATTLSGYSIPAKNSGESAMVTTSSSVSNGNGTRSASNTFTCNNGTFTAGTETSSINCSNGYTPSGSECVAVNVAPTPPIATSTPPTVSDSLSFVLTSVDEDKTGGSTFAPGGGADWGYTVTLSLASPKTIKSMRIALGGDVWTTMPEGSYWNTVIFDGGTQVNSAFTSNLNLSVGAGTKVFKLYAQKWFTTFNPGWTLTVTFTDGTTLSAVAKNQVAVRENLSQMANILEALQQLLR